MDHIFHFLYLSAKLFVPLFVFTLLPDNVALKFGVLNLNSDLIIDRLPVFVLDLIHLGLDILILEPEFIQLFSQLYYLRKVLIIAAEEATGGTFLLKSLS